MLLLSVLSLFQVVRAVYSSILSLRTPNLNRVGMHNPVRLLQDAKLTQARTVVYIACTCTCTCLVFLYFDISFITFLCVHVILPPAFADVEELTK